MFTCEYDRHIVIILLVKCNHVYANSPNQCPVPHFLIFSYQPYLLGIIHWSSTFCPPVPGVVHVGLAATGGCCAHLPEMGESRRNSASDTLCSRAWTLDRSWDPACSHLRVKTPRIRDIGIPSCSLLQVA